MLSVGLDDSKKKKLVVASCVLCCLLLITVTTSIAVKTTSSNSIIIDVAPFEISATGFTQPRALPELTEEEFYETYGTYHSSGGSGDFGNSYETYEQYVAAQTASAYATSGVTAEGANKALYDLVNKYFTVYYGNMRVSPILVLAIANVETPGRADNNITWSALFPSRYVPIDELYTFDVTSVVSNPTYFKVFSADYSTRDRGPLQMSPTYGTGDSSCNASMSGTEKEKLAQVNTSGYSTWVSGASSYPGDRFYIPDMCLRMTGAFSGQVNYMWNNSYVPADDMQLVAMLAMGHNSSGIWTNKDHNKSCGCWRSSELAYTWSSIASSPEVVEKLTELAQTSNACFIDSNKATEIMRSVGHADYSTYATNSIVCTYPVKVLYAYIKLCMLYTA